MNGTSGAVWFMLGIPVAFGAYGLALALDLFGLAREEAGMYRGRGWYPIADGGRVATHRLVGLLLFAVAVTLVVAFVHGGVL